MAADLSLDTVPVLLLKTKSSPSDGYEAFFNAASECQYRPLFVPVLEHKFRQDALAEIRNLIDGGFAGLEKKYGGIIFTSLRAVEAFSIAVEELRRSGRRVENLLSSEVPFYVVGPATARTLRALDLPAAIVGEESGNGAVLAQFILKDYSHRINRSGATGRSKPPLLFLVGEKRRDIIPNTLQSPTLNQDIRIRVDELVVYESSEMASFRSDFQSALATNQRHHVKAQWVVVFSPTGCKAALDTLGLIDPRSGKAKSGDEFAGRFSEGTRTFIATIGPTTRDYLRQEFNFDPDVCSPKPSTEGLGDAIKEYMSKNSR
jgi:uroporphyrinogen-III synthase